MRVTDGHEEKLFVCVALLCVPKVRRWLRSGDVRVQSIRDPHSWAESGWQEAEKKAIQSEAGIR